MTDSPHHLWIIAKGNEMQKEWNDIKDQRGNKKTKGARGKKSWGFPVNSERIRSVYEGSEVKLKWLDQGDLCAALLIFIRIWMSVGLLFIILLFYSFCFALLTLIRSNPIHTISIQYVLYLSRIYKNDNNITRWQTFRLWGTLQFEIKQIFHVNFPI